MRLLVTGAGGMVGSAFVREGEARGLDVLGVDRAGMDVTDAEAVGRVVHAWARAAAGPAAESSARSTTDWIVHCAAYTAVDRAESEAELAHAVNVEGSGNVARAAAEVGAGIVYLSTDYVFDGGVQTPYSPDAPTAPLSIYGETKLGGEHAVLAAYPAGATSDRPRPLIVRTGWLYGEGGRGFVRSMLNRAERGEQVRIVDDQVGGPTSVESLVGTVLHLLEVDPLRRTATVWHVADAGEATWAALAQEAFRLSGVDVAVRPVSSVSFGAPAKRPAHSVLDVSATEEALGRPMRPWTEVLKETLESSSETDH